MRLYDGKFPSEQHACGVCHVVQLQARVGITFGRLPEEV
jgi:hypothetical protein